MAYYQRKGDGLKCDRCGHLHHHPNGVTYDPQGDWCWTPVYSSEYDPCHGCGQDINAVIAYDKIIMEHANVN